MPPLQRLSLWALENFDILDGFYYKMAALGDGPGGQFKMLEGSRQASSYDREAISKWMDQKWCLPESSEKCPAWWILFWGRRALRKKEVDTWKHISENHGTLRCHTGDYFPLRRYSFWAGGKQGCWPCTSKCQEIFGTVPAESGISEDVPSHPSWCPDSPICIVKTIETRHFLEHHGWYNVTSSRRRGKKEKEKGVRESRNASLNNRNWR